MTWRLPALQSPAPKHLEGLANTLQDSGPWAALHRLPTTTLVLPLRSFGHIRRLLAANSPTKLRSVRVLEWLSFFRSAHWSRLSEAEQRSIGSRCYEVARNQPVMQDLLFLEVGLHAMLGSPSLPEGLLALPEVIHWPPAQRKRWAVARALLERDLRTFGKVCLMEGQSPREALAGLGLPRLTLNKRAPLQVACVEVFVAMRDQRVNRLAWLQSICNEGVAPVEALLMGLASKDAASLGSVRSWVMKHYGRVGGSSGWSKLSTAAQQRLRTWEASTRYDDYRAVVNAMLTHHSMVGMNKLERKELRARLWFWDCFRDRIQDVRIVLSPGAREALKQEAPDLLSRVHSAAGEKTSFCLFDLGSHQVVDVLTGTVREVRIHGPAVGTSKGLFELEHPRLDWVRSVSALQIHDTGIFWQESLLAYLSACGLHTSADATQMRTLQPRSGNISYISLPVAAGGPLLNTKQRKKRKIAWKNWLPEYVKLSFSRGTTVDTLLRLMPWPRDVVEEAVTKSRRLVQVPGDASRWRFQQPAPKKKKAKPPASKTAKSRRAAEQGTQVTGRLRIHHDGYGFVVVRGGDDVFVSPQMIQDFHLQDGGRLTVARKKNPNPKYKGKWMATQVIANH